MFSASVYSSRRKKLAEKIQKGILLFPGNQETAINYAGNTYPFRQDSTMLYLTGLDLAGVFLAVDADSGESILFGDEASIDDVIWTGPLPALASLAASAGITKVISTAGLEEFLTNQLSSGRNIHFLPPYRGKNELLLSKLTGIPTADLKKNASIELINSLVDLRSVKSEEEITEIEKAVDLTASMHLAAMKAAKPGEREGDVLAALMAELHREDAQPSFGAIISVNGQVLHNPHHRGKLQPGKLLLVDAGAESPLHYAGDMTRTFPVNASFSPEQKEIYSVVLAAQVKASDELKPGKFYRDIHLVAAKIIIEGLTSSGLMKGNPDDAVEAGAHALFFPHGLGHMMGLDVHDMENYGEDHVGYAGEVSRSQQFGLAYLRLARKLQPGFVLTVEPGIYFIPELIAKWKQENLHRDFINYDTVEKFTAFGGIRIEEDFVITGSGARRLGRPLAKSISEIEEIRKEALSK